MKMTTAPNVRIIPAKPQTAENRDKYHQLRVAAYCRVSTEQEEQQNSYQVQIAYYTDLINRKKEWTLAGIFADEGISGTQAKKRPEFLKMIRLCKKQKIDLVITKSISRFARNTVDCLEYVRQLKDLGIGVIFEKENINTLTMTSEFMIAMHGSFAQAESESISKNVSWGKQKAYAEGKVAFQYSKLLGYQKGADGKPEIVPDEAETVRLIFELFLDGYSLTSIKQTLENKELPTAMGRKIWNQSLIQSILKNEKYVGDALLQKTFTSDCITKKVVKNNGERPMYLVTNHHAPIIDRDTFNRVQQELARRSSKRKISDKTTTEQGKYSGKYALSELLICGHCGTPYRRQMWKSNGNRYAVWRCISRLDHGRRYCTDSPTIHEDKLHRAILQAVNEYLGCRNEIAKILKANIGSVLECKNQQEILNMENRLKNLDKARNDLISLISEGGCDEDTLDAEFAKIHTEEQSVNEKLSELRKNAEISADTQSKIDSTMEALEHEKFELDVFDNIIIRKLIEFIKVISKTELLIIFKGGIEVKAEMEE
ncbi:MAG: recombinase family protein [Ruminococcus sp.]|nr:recombinase family protein [Ruminococcus sp.]